MFVGLCPCIPVLIRYNQHPLPITRGIRLENLSADNLGFCAKHRYICIYTEHSRNAGMFVMSSAYRSRKLFLHFYPFRQAALLTSSRVYFHHHLPPSLSPVHLFPQRRLTLFSSSVLRPCFSKNSLSIT